MRCALFLALAICFVASASAQIFVQNTFYSTSTCASGTVTSVQNSTVLYNTLYNQTSVVGPSYYGLSYQYFPDTTAGAWSTKVSYADQGVTITSISQSYYGAGSGYPLKVCTWVTAGTWVYSTIVNYASGTAAPSAPSGFVTSQSLWNATTYQQITTCPQPTSGFVTLNNYNGVGVCQPTGVLPAGQESTAAFCGVGGAFYGSVKYGGSTCSASSILGASFSPVGNCQSGQVLTCSGGATLPSGTPTAGIITYSAASTNCLNADNLATVQVFTQNQCVDRSIYSCSTVNGTTVGTLTTYSDNACTLNPFSVSQTAATAANGNTWATATSFPTTSPYCIATGTQYRVYTCNFGSFSAASSVSVSAVALLFAALLSLFASKQL